MMIFVESFRRLLQCCVVTLIVFVAGSPASYAQQTPGVTDKEIKIGAWDPLTGTVAVYGIPWRIGFETYLKMVNDQGGVKGRKFNWIVEDNAYNVQRTLAVARQLLTRDDVFAIAGAFGVAQTAATFDYVLGESKVPIILPYAGLVEWFNPPRENLYGVLVDYEAQSHLIGRWAAKDGHRNILVIHTSLSTFNISAKEIEPAVKLVRSDASVELYPVKFDLQDYGPVALEVARKKPDAVLIFMPFTGTIALAKQLRAQGVKAELYANATVVTNSFAELGANAVEGFKATSYVVSPNIDTPAVREYREAMAKYAPNEKADFVSLFAFANAKLFVEAVRRVEGPLNRQSLVRALDSIKNFDTGILPPTTFGPTRHLGVTALYRVKIAGGKWLTEGVPVDADKNW